MRQTDTQKLKQMQRKVRLTKRYLKQLETQLLTLKKELKK